MAGSTHTVGAETPRGDPQQQSTPALTLPKGGGAIRGMGEKFSANPVTGTGSVSVPIALSPGRSGFGPQIELAYDSAAGNGPFGFGWNITLPAITRKTDTGLPRYRDAEDSDVFVLSGAEDLVPLLERDAEGRWQEAAQSERTVGGRSYRIRRYRPRVEGLFARIERWTDLADPGDVFWRTISRSNVTAWYGRTPESRISDPADPSLIFSWLICQSHDDRGNVIVHGYKPEDSARVFEDAQGDAVAKAHENNRTASTRSTQRYLKSIRYGNRVPYLPVLEAGAPWPEPPDATAPDGSDAWLFEAVLDYGEHDADAPTPGDTGEWQARRDPFSSYRAGFEVRTYRLCRRVLMFHHFPHEAGVGRNCLVRSAVLTYTDEADLTAVPNPVYAFLRAITQSGHRRRAAGYDSRSLPPVEFEYTEPVVQDTVQQVDPESLEGLPAGLDGSSYLWTDVHGEGIPGILSEQAGAWFYKRNLSPIPQPTAGGRDAVRARFDLPERVVLKPNVALRGGAEFLDLAGDGQPDVVVMDGASPGLYEHDDAGGWKAFRAFPSRLNVDMRDPNLRFVDLDGDGHADVLVTEDDALIWYLSLGEDGFGPARRVAQSLDEEKGPRLVFADLTLSVQLADMSGDGLADLVRVRNGEVCYWPNLGYGRFGARVTMDNAPWFDNPDQFDPARLRLADIDGSGTTDLVYLHRDGVRLYFNQSGNSWSRPQHLGVLPPADDVASILTLDLLGNGTACLVWSSPLAGEAGRHMRYVNLMGGTRPHLLAGIANNLGAETRIRYAPSTKFYLLDRRDGRPWVTRLPMPVHVVEEVVTYDHVSRNRFVTRYAYHHGDYDGEEREFRGFGMIEQWDTAEMAALGDGDPPAANIAPESHVPPVRTRTWFHTGAHLGREHVSDYFAGLLGPTDPGEYFREPGLTDAEARAQLLPDTTLPDGLTVEEEREACRALRGVMLRQEVYADDAGPGAAPELVARALTPYTVTEQSFTVRMAQPRAGNPNAVFFSHPREVVSHHYERAPADPRTQHELTLEVDPVGTVLKHASIGYGRRTEVLTVDDQGTVRRQPNPGLALLAPADQAKQTTPLLTYTENRVTGAIEAPDAHRTPLGCEAVTFELTGYTATGAAGRYQPADLVEPDPAAPGRLRHRFTDQIPYEATATGNACRRPVEWLRTLYRRDDLDGLLPLGETGSMALPGESYRLALTPGLLSGLFQRPVAGQPAQPLLPDPASVLGGQGGDRGGYLPSQALTADGRFPATDPADHWWVPSGRSFFTTDPADAAAAELAQARQHFFTRRRYRDPFGHDAVVGFDAHDLLMTEIRDVLGNRVTVDVNDYRVLQPRVVSDPNRNRTEVAFDALGMVVGTAVAGKPLPAPQEGDTLTGFAADLTDAQIDAFFGAAGPQAGAAGLLGDATTRVVHDLHRFRRTRQANPGTPEAWLPACAATLARETHVHDPVPHQGPRIQVSLSYSDGFGREVQRKLPAEPGPLDVTDPQAPVVSPRWVGTGWTIHNNKGKPVRQYEPFFSATREYEFAAIAGVSPVVFYDPAERVVATLYPNHTYEKVVFDPWQQTTHDVNDTSAPRAGETGDPRTDPDIRGYVSAYFAALPAAAQPWETWHDQRAGGALGADEQVAAEMAAAHAGTPTTAHFDALGRPVLTVARNRVVCPGHELDGTEDAIATRVDLDIEGNQLAVLDERALPIDHLPVGAVEQRVVLRHVYDMLGNPLRETGMDTGARWMLGDVTGRPIRAWDSRGHDFTTTYDALRRPVAHAVRGTSAQSDPRTLNRDIVVDRIEYGEAAPGAEALNLRTRVLRHADSAGVATNARLDATGTPTAAFDFKGNLLHSTRRFTSDYTAIPDWGADPQLDAETFEASTRYDALNRRVQLIPPHSSLPRSPRHVIQPVLNEANLLEAVHVWLERPADPAALLDPAAEPPSPAGVAGIDYDAKGQRLRVQHANGATTSYSYDPLTFRLTRLVTARGSAQFPGDDPNPPVPGWPGTQVQNLRYTYDPTGNITRIRDDAQQAVFFRNRRVEPGNVYTYDALYRLVQAGGREHLGQAGVPVPHSDDDTERVGVPSGDAAGLFAPNDGVAMGAYTERYVYDAVGNLLQLRHRGTDPAHPGWRRRFTYDEASLLAAGQRSNRLSSTRLGNGAGAVLEEYEHDVLGNVVRMPHLGGGQPGANMSWDYAGEFHLAQLGGGGTVHHVYDASGQRVRKVWEKAPGLVEERLYLGGSEIFRRHGGPIGPDTATLERETLHVMDDRQRIAVVETRTLDTGGGDPAPRQLIRVQCGNHQGSAALELDEAARIITYEEFTPYGSTAYQAVRSKTETPKRYRYTGKERDDETGFTYHGARYCAPWLGRWTSADPRGTVDGTNVYAYARGNPVSYTDPTGTQCDPTNACCIDPTAPPPAPGTAGTSSSAKSSSSATLPGAGGSAAAVGQRLMSSAAPALPTSAPLQAANSVDDLLTFLHAQSGFETGAQRPPTFNPRSASPFGTAAHANATRVLDQMKQLGFKDADRIFSEVRAVNGTVTQIGGTPGGPAGSHNMDVVVARPGQTISVGQSLSGGAAESIGDLKYGGGTIDPKYNVHGSPTVTINGRTTAGVPPAAPPAAPPPTSGARTVIRAGGTVLGVAGTAYSAYAFGDDISEGRWGSAALNGSSFAGGGLVLGGTAAGSSTLVAAGTAIGAPAAVAGAGYAGWKLGEYTNENTAIGDVAAAGGSLVERATGSTTLGAVGAATTAVVTAPVFVPIAVGKGIGRGAVWVWNKIF